MQKMHVRLLVEKQGLLATRLQYEVMLRGLEQAHGISIGMVRRLEIPDFPQEQIVLVNIFLLETASVLMARGFPVDHVAQAFAAFAVLTGERVAGETYVLAMLRETYEAIQPGNFS